MENSKLLILNLPNPHRRKVIRDFAGGFGIAVPLSRIRRKQSGRPYLNLFLPYSAAVAQESSCEFKILDAQAFELSKQAIVKSVDKFNPDIIFSMISLPAIFEETKLLKDLKEELPNALVVGCGSVCNTIPEKVLEESNLDLVANDSFPYVNSLNTLLSNYKRMADFKRIPGFSLINNGKLRTNQPEPARKEFADYVPIYDVLPLKEYENVTTFNGEKCVHIPILGSVGCPYPCSYCPYPIGFGKRTIFKNPISVVDEMQHLHEIGIMYFDFRNQSFTLDRGWANAICSEIIKRKLDVSWLCEARVDETSREMLTVMHSAGCERINYGVETGDPSLIEIGKPGVRLQNTRDAFKTARDIGIWRHAHMILGLPGENIKTLQVTNEFLLELDPDSLTLNFATPYPGTKMYELAEKNNWLITHDWAYYSSFDVVMIPPGVNAENLYRMAFQIEKDLLMRKTKQSSLKKSTANKFKLVASYYVQAVIDDLRFRSRIHNFRKRLRTDTHQNINQGNLFS